MNVVDSSAWLEYFADGPNADFFAGAVEETEALVVPTLSLYEVFKRILQQRSEDEALAAIAVMLATARAHDAVLWTQHADFEGMAGVRYQPAGG
ncbi:MAG: type II toxin-antitoxin system VapC family toxin [Gemmatimonadota bacterium]